jgi:hypothetical protein
VVLILTIAGMVAGILLASAALEDTLKVTVTDTEVQFQKNRRTRRVPREQIRSLRSARLPVVGPGRPVP